MRKTLAIGTLAILVSLFGSGCMTFHTKVQTTHVSSAAVIKVSATQPVAVMNVSTNAPGTEQLVGKWIGWKVRGSLFDFTESAVGAAREALKSSNVKISGEANKRLELTIDKATSVQGAAVFCATVVLKVKTGSGVVKEFTGAQRYGNGYATTPAFEKAIGESVVKMLQDKDIVAYLENT